MYNIQFFNQGTHKWETLIEASTMKPFAWNTQVEAIQDAENLGFQNIRPVVSTKQEETI